MLVNHIAKHCPAELKTRPVKRRGQLPSSTKEPTASAVIWDGGASLEVGLPSLKSTVMALVSPDVINYHILSLQIGRISSLRTLAVVGSREG